jgi:hypothetical protein
MLIVWKKRETISRFKLKFLLNYISSYLNNRDKNSSLFLLSALSKVSLFRDFCSNSIKKVN